MMPRAYYDKTRGDLLITFPPFLFIFHYICIYLAHTIRIIKVFNQYLNQQPEITKISWKRIEEI